MLYVLIVVLCLGGVCESSVWRDLMPAWECMEDAYELEEASGPDWYVERATCQRMFQTGGLEV